MRQVIRSALVPESPEKMFELIGDVERYPQFVPGCEGGRVLSRDGDEVVAALDVRRGPLRLSFTTRNRVVPPDRIEMVLVEGPFRALAGQWTLTAIQDAAGAALGCRVELSLRFEFKSSVAAALLEPVFEHTAASLVDAFVARARALRQGTG